MSKMTDEEKQATLEAEEKAKADAKAQTEAQDAEFEESIADLTDEEKEAKRTERKAKQPNIDNIDYKAIAEGEKEKRLKAEKAAADAAFKLRQQKREEGGDGNDNDDDKPLTKGELRSILAQNNQVTQKTLIVNQATIIAGTLAGTDGEADAIVETWKNRIFPDGMDLQDQIEETYAIVNRRKLIGERNEALRGLKGKDAARIDAATGHQAGQKVTVSEPKLEADMKSVLVRQGYKFNRDKVRWEKKLANGKYLVKNLKTGKLTVEAL